MSEDRPHLEALVEALAVATVSFDAAEANPTEDYDGSTFVRDHLLPALKQQGLKLIPEAETIRGKVTIRVFAEDAEGNPIDLRWWG